MLFNEVCHCRCHNEGAHVKHIMACCDKCSFCRQRIKWADYESHVKKCEDKHDPPINGVRFSAIIQAMKVLEDADLDVSSISKQVKELLGSVFGK